MSAEFQDNTAIRPNNDFNPYRQMTILAAPTLIYRGKPGNRHLFITNLDAALPLIISNQRDVSATNGHALLPGMVDLSTEEHVDLSKDIYAFGVAAGISITIAEASDRDPR